MIGVVATNARLTKEQAGKMAQMAQDGLARAIRPAHTMLDGDTIFSLATGNRRADVSLVGACAAEAFARAVVKAALAASAAGGLTRGSDLRREIRSSYRNPRRTRRTRRKEIYLFFVPFVTSVDNSSVRPI